MRPWLARGIVRLAAVIVPGERRAAWTEEWLAEVAAAEADGRAASRGLIARVLGAPYDATALRTIALRASVHEWRVGLPLDVRQAIRIFRTDPGHTFGVGGCLALGVTIALGTFAVVDGLLFGEIAGITKRASLSSVYLEEQLGPRGSVFIAPRTFDFEFIRQRAADVDVAAAGVLVLAARLGDDDVPVRVALVSGNYFGVLGTTAEAGRLLLPRDDQSAAPVAVVSRRFQNARLGQVWNRPLVVSGRQLGIVGVAQVGLGSDGKSALHEDFAAIDIWVPLTLAPAWAPAGPQSAFVLDLLARLPAGSSNDQIQQRLAGALAGFTSNSGRQPTVHLQRFGYPRDADPSRAVLFAAAMMAAPLLVVIIACANVANLRLARAGARARDLAVRLSLGATRTQLVRLLVLESIALAALGTALGGFGAWAVLKALSARLPLSFALNVQEIVFTAGLLAGVTVLAGMAPAMMTTRRLMQLGLRKGGRAATLSHSRTRHLMVAVQVALSLGLLVVAAVLSRSLHSAFTAVPALAHEVLVGTVDVSRLGAAGSAAQQMATDFATRVSSDVRVQSVGYSDQGLFGGQHLYYLRPGQNEPDGRIDPVHVSPGWFGAAGVHRVAGRTLTESDAGTSVAVIDATMAARLAPRGSPIGMTLRLRTGRGAASDVPVQIVGVVSDAMRNPKASRPDSCIYLPITPTLLSGRDFPARFSVFIRTNEPEAVRQALRRLIAEVEPGGAWTPLDTAAEILSSQQSGERRALMAMGAVSVLALALAAAGLYGAISYVVSLRSREIGIRIAIGARSREVIQLVVRQALAPVASGMILGLPIALSGVQILRASLPAVSSFDPVAFLSAVIVLVAVTVAASAAPALRAARIDPVRVLRLE